MVQPTGPGAGGRYGGPSWLLSRCGPGDPSGWNLWESLALFVLRKFRDSFYLWQPINSRIFCLVRACDAGFDFGGSRLAAPAPKRHLMEWMKKNITGTALFFIFT